MNTDKADYYPQTAVIGIGGAGCNIVKKFMESLTPADVIAIDTDAESLSSAVADYKFSIDGCVKDFDDGDVSENILCSRSDSEKLSKILKRYDIVTIIAGMGGKTGTFIAPVVVEIADELGVLSMAVAVKPLSSENRDMIAKAGATKLKSVCSGTVSVYNEKVRNKYPDMSSSEIFDKVNTEVELFVNKKMKMASDLLTAEIIKAMSSRSKKENVGTGRYGTVFA